METDEITKIEYKFPDGKKYEGGYKRKMAHGYGKLSFPDGRKYEGKFENGKLHGTIIYMHTDGLLYECEFQAGKRIGNWKRHRSLVKDSDVRGIRKLQDSSAQMLDCANDNDSLSALSEASNNHLEKGMRLVGRVKVKGRNCILIDNESTKYEIFNFDHRLRRAEFSPEFCDVRVKQQNSSAKSVKNHYYVFKMNLYRSENPLDYDDEMRITERYSELPRSNAPRESDCTLIPPSSLQSRTENDISQMTGLEFEQLIKELLIKMGFEVEQTKQTGDGGIDLIAFNSAPVLKGKYIVQCKRWNNNVGETYVRDLYGVVTAQHANKGILITNSTFTSSAILFSENKPIELIDGEKLNMLLNDYGLTRKSNYAKFDTYARALAGQSL